MNKIDTWTKKKKMFCNKHGDISITGEYFLMFFPHQFCKQFVKSFTNTLRSFTGEICYRMHFLNNGTNKL